MNENLKERLYKNTMELTSLKQMLDKLTKEWKEANNGFDPDFGKLSLISARMSILFHKLDTVYNENKRLHEELEQEMFE